MISPYKRLAILPVMKDSFCDAGFRFTGRDFSDAARIPGRAFESFLQPLLPTNRPYNHKTPYHS